jgi:ubiquinol-cytochrome c reductase iron-sulfur subunit
LIIGLTKIGNLSLHLLKFVVKIQINNFRVHNEHETDLRRTQAYLLSAVYYAGVLSMARVYAIGVIGRLNGWKRYDKDTYMELDINDLPPGEVMQIGWNGNFF